MLRSPERSEGKPTNERLRDSRGDGGTCGLSRAERGKPTDEGLAEPDAGDVPDPCSPLAGFRVRVFAFSPARAGGQDDDCAIGTFDDIPTQGTPVGYTAAKCLLTMATGWCSQSGLFHYFMRSPDGHEMWRKFVYREIVVPARLQRRRGLGGAEPGKARQLPKGSA